MGPAQVDADGAAARRDGHVLDDPGRAVDAAKTAAAPAPGRGEAGRRPRAKPEPAPSPKPEPKGPPIAAKEVDGTVVLVFPAERFDLDVAAALGKRDWDTVVRRSDNLPGAMRDKIQRDGASWIAPLEFLSEVFVDGKPLTKQQFEKDARTVDGVRALDVHFPRFGDVVLLDVPGKGRFVTSLTDRAERAAALVPVMPRSLASRVAIAARGSATARADDDFAGAHDHLRARRLAVSRRPARQGRDRDRDARRAKAHRARAAHRRRRHGAARRSRRQVVVDAARRLDQAR